jgi:hypothetical protein
MLEDVLHHKVEHMTRNHPGNPNKIIEGSAKHITSYKHVYMMRLASRFALHV